MKVNMILSIGYTVRRAWIHGQMQKLAADLRRVPRRERGALVQRTFARLCRDGVRFTSKLVPIELAPTPKENQAAQEFFNDGVG